MRGVSLHHHSTLSFQDGHRPPSAHVARSAELGMTAMALTEHGNVSSHVPLEKAALKAGIKPIFGLEAYTGPTNMRETGNTRKWHLTLLAMDQTGYINLMRLVSESWAEGFYRWPTVTGPMLEKYQEGLICLSGCADSLLACRLLGGKGEGAKGEQAARRTIERFRGIFGDRYYLEAQQFPELERTRTLNPWLAEQSKRYKIPLVGTADVHYPYPDDNEMQLILHAAGRGAANISQQAEGWEYDIRLTHPVSDRFWRDRLMATGLTRRQANGAVLETESVAQRCNVILPKADRFRFPLAEGQSTKELIWDWIRRGWKYRWKRNARMRADPLAYKARVLSEMGPIESKDFFDYFLMLSEAVRFAKDRGIAVGPARGSAAASLVCYLLRITEVDPLQFPMMLFERFIAVDRTDVPDVDLDFGDERRDEVRQHMVEMYGADRVGNIGTFTKYRGKNALIDIARVNNVPDYELKTIKDLMIERSSGDARAGATLEDTINMFPAAQKVMEKYPVLWKALRLEGDYRSMSVHAAGVVVSNTPLTDSVAMYERQMGTGKNKHTRQVLSVDKYDAEYLNLMKADFLGLSTLGMIEIALGLIGMKLDDMYTVDLEDPKVLQAFRNGDVTGIFQFGGGATRIVNDDVSPDRFIELSDINALSRPGPLHSGSTQDYIDIKHGRKSRPKLHPAVEKISGWTHGQIIYQEQILAIVREIGDFDWLHAGELRKIISQKHGNAAFNLKFEMFKEGAKRMHNMDEEEAHEIWVRMATAGTYAFCLTGDAVIKTGGRGGRGSGGSEYALKELWEAYNSKTPLGEKLRYGQRGRRINIQQMQDDGRVRPAQFLSIQRSPVEMPLYEVKLANGNSFRSTIMHRCLTPNGYREVGELRPGDQLVCAGLKEPRPPRPSQAYHKQGAGMSGPGNPAWIDGRSGALRDAQAETLLRSKDCCEWCSLPNDGRPHTLEFAHILDLNSLLGDYVKYHAAANMLHLCNSCHKKFDYQKGERVKRHTRGLPTETSAIVSITPVGMGHVYMIEMRDAPHNYVANGVVHHNNIAHSVSYAMLAYWTMWLKVYHPLEFYTACLLKYNDADDQYFMLRDAIKHGIEVRPPDLALSGATWSIKDGAIQGGFAQLPGIGASLGEEIVRHREEGNEFELLVWDDLIRVKGIGPAKLKELLTAAGTDDPFGIHHIDKALGAVRKMIADKSLPLPRPTHRADEIPTDGRNRTVVIIGVPTKRDSRDVVEDERGQTGEDREVILARMKRPDLVKRMVLHILDETDATVYLRWNRFSFPAVEQALWSVRLDHDVIVARGQKRAGFGTSVYVDDLWVIDPDS